MSSEDDYAALFDRVPVGWSEVRYKGRRYGLTRSVAAAGRAMAVYAEELGGRDIVSANLYLTAGGSELRACEMPSAKVIDFLAGFEPVEQTPA
ncbi:MAG TPA: peptide methionine sulfoxide reductase [Frankiaceae bacterium]|jgi:peptide-methionine (S)-S-oxide reductase|nr:peptide methionine sulfoxide reductase [Frankiaceae bacterium]